MRLVQPFRATDCQDLGGALSRFDWPSEHRRLRRPTKPWPDGALRDDTRQVYLHFTWGQPDSQATLDYLQRLLALARGLRKQYLVIIWDNASWHLSRRVRAWLKLYRQQARTTNDVRLLVCYLPSKSPCLNPIEPRWTHAKRQTLEPAPLPLLPHQVRQRLFHYFGTKPLLPCSAYHA